MQAWTRTTSALGITLLLAASASAYTAVEVTDGGRIKGTVKYKGDPPAPVKLKVTKDGNVCGEEKIEPKLLVASDGGIKNVVVRLTDITQGKKLEVPSTNPVFDQKGCEFHPHVLLFPAGSTLDILNSDGILHNVHTTSDANPSFNQAQPKFKKKIQKKIEKPETIKVVCDAHGWMSGWWVAQEHPYYAVTDETGAFSIVDVPPGTYELEIWHETLGKHTQSVTVNANEEATLAIEMAKG